MKIFKSKLNKFIEDVYSSLNYLDLHCAWFGIAAPKSQNKIIFDQDEKGNGKGGWLELTFYNDFAKFSRGLHLLTKQEKEMFFYYENSETIEQFADKLGEFIIKYFKSIKIQYIRK